MTNVVRIPRPTGTTILAQQMHKAKSQKVYQQRKDRLISHIVNIYTMSGFRLNGKPLSIPQLAVVLRTKTEKIQSFLLGSTHTLEAFKSPEKLQETANALASMSTMWAIQDRGSIQSQLDILLQSQDGKYTPFVSGEISRLLSTLLASNKQLSEIFKTFYSQGNSLIINNNQISSQQSNYLTIEEAYKITKQPDIPISKDQREANILPPENLGTLLESYKPDTGLIHQFDHLDNSSASQPPKQNNLENTTSTTTYISNYIDSNYREYEEAEVLEEGKQKDNDNHIPEHNASSVEKEGVEEEVGDKAHISDIRSSPREGFAGGLTSPNVLSSNDLKALEHPSDEAILLSEKADLVSDSKAIEPLTINDLQNYQKIGKLTKTCPSTPTKLPKKLYTKGSERHDESLSRRGYKVIMADDLPNRENQPLPKKKPKSKA